MKLSEHFSLAELCHSQTALRHGLENSPGERELRCLRHLAEDFLEPLRRLVGRPFSPTSGYRCPPLNRLIGSSDTSQHVRGEAVDLKIPGFDLRELASLIRRELTFDQLILEYHRVAEPDSGWLHCSLVDPASGRKNRGQALIFDGTTYREMDDVLTVQADR
ncbi:D-Ala-D-Ala carboxypeptidase family metallohydrolase [Emcibacter sp.]|uniref:D-Ala-D-Ala carboxypeptidase family metallohydrolase n=1 Tax=Emcibacter sp. TaxID=1979954 RepID=UPI003A931306